VAGTWTARPVTLGIERVLLRHLDVSWLWEDSLRDAIAIELTISHL
jgi:hypothetical protein